MLLYKMAVAYFPNQISKKSKYEINFREIDWKNKSEELRKFVLCLLNVNPEERPSAKEALQHAWFIK